MNTFINHNGNLLPSDQPVIGAANRGFRYGDGVFETIRVTAGQIALVNYHIERLFSGMNLLQFERPASFTQDMLTRQIIALCEKNNHSPSARVRLSVFRGNGGLYDPENHLPNYIIETWPLQEIPDEKDLRTGIFPDGRKTMDLFSNLKSANYLIYAMAALYAKNQGLDDCLILNSAGRICDSTIANIFCVKKGIICTPPLSEGCVAGVMRRHLLEQAAHAGYKVLEMEMDASFLLGADELFLTNALRGIRPVKQLGDKNYGSKIGVSLHALINKTTTLQPAD